MSAHAVVGLVSLVALVGAPFLAAWIWIHRTPAGGWPEGRADFYPRGFNVGAFACPAAFGLFTRSYVGLASIPAAAFGPLALAFHLWFGYSSTSMSWKKGRWRGAGHWKLVLHRWNVFGAIYLVVLVAAASVFVFA